MTMQRVSVAEQLAPSTLAWVTIEDDPAEVYDDSVDINADVAAALGSWDDPRVTRLRSLLDNPDGSKCEGNTCDRPVGYVLHEPEDITDRGGLFWQYTALVTLPSGKVLAVCEDCSPGTVYDPEEG